MIYSKNQVFFEIFLPVFKKGLHMKMITTLLITAFISPVIFWLERFSGFSCLTQRILRKFRTRWHVVAVVKHSTEQRRAAHVGVAAAIRV
jgi:hypothetical protein